MLAISATSSGSHYMVLQQRSARLPFCVSISNGGSMSQSPLLSWVSRSSWSRDKHPPSCREHSIKHTSGSCPHHAICTSEEYFQGCWEPQGLRLWHHHVRYGRGSKRGYHQHICASIIQWQWLFPTYHLDRTRYREQFDHINRAFNIDLNQFGTIVKVIDTQVMGLAVGIKERAGHLESLKDLLEHFRIKIKNLHTGE